MEMSSQRKYEIELYELERQRRQEEAEVMLGPAGGVVWVYWLAEGSVVGETRRRLGFGGWAAQVRINGAVSAEGRRGALLPLLLLLLLLLLELTTAVATSARPLLAVLRERSFRPKVTAVAAGGA